MNVIYLDFTIHLDNHHQIVSKDSDDEHFNIEVLNGSSSTRIRLNSSQAKDFANYLLKKPRNHRDTAYPLSLSPEELTSMGG